MKTGAERLQEFPLGTRVVVRYKLSNPVIEPLSDALGELREIDATRCVIDTRSGLLTVPLADVVLAKAVPPPPAKVRRRPLA